MNRSTKRPRVSPGRSRREALGLLGAGGRLARQRCCACARRREGADGSAGVARSGYSGGGNRQGDINDRRMVRLSMPVLPQGRAGACARWCMTTARSGWSGRIGRSSGPVSVVAARMALASRYQDKFLQAHDALIAVNSKLTEPRIRERFRAPASMSIASIVTSPTRQARSMRPGPQQRSGDRVRIQRYAFLHCRQVPCAGCADHGAVRPGHRGRAKGSRGKEEGQQVRWPA